jgi:hypothetical protein
MRYAVRTVKNPTSIPLDVIQQKDGLELRVSNTAAFKALPLTDRMNFISYIHTLADYMTSEGAKVYVTGTQI